MTQHALPKIGDINTFECKVVNKKNIDYANGQAIEYWILAKNLTNKWLTPKDETRLFCIDSAFTPDEFGIIDGVIEAGVEFNAKLCEFHVEPHGIFQIPSHNFTDWVITGIVAKQK